MFHPLRLVFIFTTALLLQGCGGSKSPGGSLPNLQLIPFSPLQAPTNITATHSAAQLVPGAYFKILTDVGPNKDTRVVEFQYLSGNRFIATETFFPAGNLSSTPYFHKKAGSFSVDSSNKISHTTSTDSCGELGVFFTYMSGVKGYAVNVTWNGNVVGFYSYGSWSLPSDISSSIVNAVEDTGCLKFKNAY